MLDTKRATFQAAIRRRATKSQRSLQRAKGHGWAIVYEEIEINWIQSDLHQMKFWNVYLAIEKSCALSKNVVVWNWTPMYRFEYTNLSVIEWENVCKEMLNNDSSDHSYGEYWTIFNIFYSEIY